MVLDLVIIGLVIALLPLTIVAFTRILGAQQGIWKGLAFMAGWLACLVAVIAVVVLVTGDKPPAPHTATSTAALVVKALLGGLLIWVGLRQRRRMGRPRKQPGWMARLDHLSLWAAAGLGVFLQPWSLVAAGGDGHASQAVHRGRLAGAGPVLPAGHVELPGHGALRDRRLAAGHAHGFDCRGSRHGPEAHEKPPQSGQGPVT